jgi:ABC-2 type transport system ATP-binding protein
MVRKKEILVINKMTKNFGNFNAVDNLSLKVKEGTIYGLLGPNGAGKTTLIKILCTILKPTKGTTTINGLSLTDNSYEIRKQIGVVFQDQSIDEELTAEENMVFHGKIYGLTNQEIKLKIKKLLKIVELYDVRSKTVNKFSGGMKRRLEIARSLMHEPKVLFLDEPTVGLDPQTRIKIWDYIKYINKEHNVTIILTTHYMDEADKLCKYVGIIDNGKIIANDTPKTLKNRLDGDTITVNSDKIDVLLNLFSKEKEIIRILKNFKNLVITTKKAENVIPKLISIANQKKIRIHSISIHKPSLEDVFLYYTGKNIRPENAHSSISNFMRMRNRK